MDEEIQKPEPKISDVEIVLIGIFYFGLDIVDFIPTVGDVTDLVASPMGFYYWMKGINGTAFLASEVIEAVPGAQELPFVRTITWGINIWLDRHPKLTAAFATVEAIEGGVDALQSEGVGGAEELSESRGIAAETSGGGGNAAVGVQEQGAGVGGSGEVEVESGRPSSQTTERDITKNESEGEREAKQSGRGATEAGEPGETNVDVGVSAGADAGAQGESDEKKREDEKKEAAAQELRQGAEILPEEQAMKTDFPEAEDLQKKSPLEKRWAREQAKFGASSGRQGIHLVKPREKEAEEGQDDERNDMRLPDAA